MIRYLQIAVLFIFAIALSLGFYFWQFNPNLFQTKTESQTSGNTTLEDYYNTGKDLINTKPETDVTFLAVGDIMLSRDVAATMARSNKDGLLPFRNLDALLTSTNFNFGNLESPFSGRNEFYAKDNLVFNAPPWAISGLMQYNFKILNLANNHAMDQGSEALLHTKKYLADNYLKGIGVGANLDEAWGGDVITTKGITIGFIGASYASQNDNGASKNNYVARIDDKVRLKESIAYMKKRSDFVVVTMHAGTEYERNPNQQQTEFARAAIDVGADIVIGAHPHWVQTIEQYQGKYIFYSLGNFVFDQEWSQDTKESLTLKITVTKQGACSPEVDSGNQNPYSPSKQQTVACSDDIQGSRLGATIKQIELIPVIIENYSTPRLATEIEKQKIFQKIGVTNSLLK